MANKSYGTWSPPGIKDGSRRSHFSVEPTPGPSRRSADDSRQVPSSYALSNTFTPHSTGSRPADRMILRPQSSGSNMTTSSLTGAVGNTHLSSHSQHSGSVSPTDPTYLQGVAWTPTQQHTASTQSPYTGIQQQSGSNNMPYHNLSSGTGPSAGPYIQYQDYNQTSYHNSSPESHSPPPNPSYSDPQFAFHSTRPQSSIRSPTVSSSARSEPYGTLPQPLPAHSRPPSSFSTPEQYENEILRLRKKIRELEVINESAHLRHQDLEREPAGAQLVPSQVYGSDNYQHSGGLPPSHPPSSQSPAFQASWKARTDARISQFCSLNRAGNALCAWHDSRRERRAYPPRMAPPGHLNCGCTFEEALFEESLSRHGVGSYHPGENVRMDPALRNPLLKLLQARYGYRDGDFERDIITGNWVEGDGHEIWEHKATLSARKK